MIVQLSDLHLGASGPADPVEDARHAIRAVAELRPAPAAVLISGDLADHGDPAEYALLRELTAELPMPVHVMAGNHDDREALLAAFPVPDARGDRYRWAADLGGLRVVACDTGIPGRDDGRLDADELGWLQGRLATDETTPTILAMHHPPIEIGIPVLDAIGLRAEDRAALTDLVSRAPQVQRIVCGHVHMPIAAQVGPTPVISSPSTWRYRVRLEIGAEEFRLTELPAGMLVHVSVNGRLVSYVHPIGAPSP